MAVPVRGEFWRARLNLNPEDPGHLRSAQMRSMGRYVLVVSRDEVNRTVDTATVVPRTRHLGTITGGVRSPRRDGGCNDEATIDCSQVYSIWQPNLGIAVEESQLSAPIRRGARTKVLSRVEASLRTYFSQHDGHGYEDTLSIKGVMLDGRGSNPQGQIVEARWESNSPCECVVVSNSTMNARRPLPLLTVIPCIPTRELPESKVPNSIVLRAMEDGVSEDCIALFEQPYTIDPRFHVSQRLGQVRQSLLGQILDSLGAYLNLPKIPISDRLLP